MPPGEELYEFACDENNVDRDGGHLGYGPIDLKAYPLNPVAPKKIAQPNSRGSAALNIAPKKLLGSANSLL